MMMVMGKMMMVFDRVNDNKNRADDNDDDGVDYDDDDDDGEGAHSGKDGEKMAEH